MKSAKKKSSNRPRTVHIDVYCTASDTEDSAPANGETDESRDSDESNTSSCFTVVRSEQTQVRHVRKKHGLPLGLMPSPSGSTSKASGKPILSYRINAKELVDAVERKIQASGDRTPLEEELFRDTTSDSSILWADSDSDSCSNVFHRDSFEYDDDNDQQRIKDKFRTWQSPEEARKKQMLEQRKQQWRAAKIFDESSSLNHNSFKSEGSARSSRASSKSSDKRRGHSSLKTRSELKCDAEMPILAALRKEASLAPKSRTGSEKLSRQGSQRCPSIECGPTMRRHDSKQSYKQTGLLTVPHPSADRRHSTSDADVVCSAWGAAEADYSAQSADFHYEECKNSVRAEPSSTDFTDVASRLAFRGTSEAPTVTTRLHRGAINKYGHHVGPTRNPNCACLHCVDYFSNVGGR